MTVLIEDPLIAGMAISRPLPLHESSRRLRELYPECPRVYGVAVMGDLSRRRWWPLADGADHRPAADDVRASPPRRPTAGPPWPSNWPRRWPTSSSAGSSRCWSSRAGRGTPAWRTCGCTSTPRARSTGSGVVDPHPACAARRSGRWTATASSRCRARPRWPPGSLIAAIARWSRCSRRLLRRQRRRDVGRVDVAHRRRLRWSAPRTQVPLLAGSSELTSMRRGAGGARRPGRVRAAGARHDPDDSQGRPCLIRAALPILLTLPKTRTTGPRRSPEGCRDSRSTRRRAPRTRRGARPHFSGLTCRCSAAVGPVLESAHVVDLGRSPFP